MVVLYNMRREGVRTLYTLSAAYQQEVGVDQYEVIVVENGSKEPLDPAVVAEFGSNFRYFRFDRPSKSPVGAINFGISQARGDAVAVMIDGARMLSPGILKWTLVGMRSFERVAVTVPSYHLGPDVQNRSVVKGYNQAVEDELLATRDWRTDGYELFDLCERFDPACENAAWFAPVNESNFVVCTRKVFDEIGGYEPRFTSAGGGACNLDFLHRLVHQAGCKVLSLAGEGTFHQFHGGVSTNVAEDVHPWPEIKAEYAGIRGREWQNPEYDPILFGSFSDKGRWLLARMPDFFTYVEEPGPEAPAPPKRALLQRIAARLGLSR